MCNPLRILQCLDGKTVTQLEATERYGTRHR